MSLDLARLRLQETARVYAVILLAIKSDRLEKPNSGNPFASHHQQTAPVCRFLIAIVSLNLKIDASTPALYWPLADARVRFRENFPTSPGKFPSAVLLHAVKR
ncbi:MAG: hypothetical protein K0U34_01280, partial [Alphaproteobacteria bacterium]|nr:hypothetical protein [Alphaproteobacteria bacterium]